MHIVATHHDRVLSSRSITQFTPQIPLPECYQHGYLAQSRSGSFNEIALQAPFQQLLPFQTCGKVALQCHYEGRVGGWQHNVRHGPRLGRFGSRTAVAATLHKRWQDNGAPTRTPTRARTRAPTRAPTRARHLRGHLHGHLRGPSGRLRSPRQNGHELSSTLRYVSTVTCSDPRFKIIVELKPGNGAMPINREARSEVRGPRSEMRGTLDH